MRINSRALVSFFFAVALAGLGAVLFHGQEAMAQSSFFSSRGCTGCHSAPTAATCAGCHHHSGTLTATKNKTTTYAPGETVTITLTASGARSGWIGARLYDQSGAEIARSTGSQSGMGGSTTFPAALSAPAPAAAGTYTWRMAYFGNEDGNGTGDVHSEISVNVSITVAAAVDATAPVVGAFTLPATATTLTVPVSSLTATDNVAVTGYLVTTSATAPLVSAAGWTATAPASVTAPAAGSVTFFAWAKDAAGNVSASRSAAVNITLSDASAPVVSAFTLPANGASLTVPVNSFTATDNVGVTGYIVTLSATPPASGAAGWTATAPANVVATTSGSITFFAWAKDAAGNVSAAGSSATVSISIETTPPTLTISTLANGAVTNNATLNVTGTVSDASGIAGVTVNGAALTVTGGAFSTALPLISGANTITTIATDNVGNQTTDTRTINLDQAGPLLNVNSPADNSKINQTFVDVTGTVSENSTVTVNGAGAAINGLNFSANVLLVAGLNTIDITATDLGGNISTLKRSITSDPVAPSLAVTVPSQDITSTTASNTISGTVSDALTAVTVAITADGKSYTPAVAGGSFTQAITLSASNTYAVIVTATDEAGNQISVTRNIIFTQSTIGDINGDSQTDIQDALMALKLSVNLMPMNNSYMAQGDVAPYVNGHSQPDGHIDISDALAILKMSVGLLPSTL